MTDRDFNRNFLLSLGIHLWIAGLAWLAAGVFKDVFQHKDIEIIRSSVRVDIVGMPKFTVQELKAMQNEPIVAEPVEEKGAKVETKKAETEDVINKNDLVVQEADKKKKKASFLNLISDYSSKKVAPKDTKKGTKTGSENKELDTLILEGNRLSKGSSLTGDFTDQENSEFSSYVQSMPDQVRKFWTLPSYLKEQNLKCRVKVFLSSSGSLLKTEVVESSGVGEFDSKAVSAIKQAAPFSRPSEKVAARLSNYGIILGFPL